LRELRESPETHAKKYWEFEKEYSAEEIAEFTGPTDPRYIARLQNEYINGLNRSRARLEEVMKAKP
jgi:hypothetical protein